MVNENGIYKANSWIAAAIGLFYIYSFAVLPLVLLPMSIWWAVSLIPLLWVHITHWGLIHEAIHKHFSNNSLKNEYAGRGLGILLGVSFHIVRFGHLMHHKLNRDWQSEVVPENNFKTKLNYYWNLLGGLWVTEFLGGLLMAVLSKKNFLNLAASDELTKNSDVLLAGERMFYIKGNARFVRIDMMAVMVLHSLAFIAYAAYWPILAAFIVARAVVISFMDNIYHYGTEHHEAGKDLELPKIAAAALLNSNYHNTHHLNPSVPWKKLPEYHAQKGLGFAGGLIKNGLMQLNGPISRAA